MKKIAILPLRAGSKSIINKNKKKLIGRPLFTWCLGEAILSRLDSIYIFTDDHDIIDYVNKEYKWNEKVKVMQRSSESATDMASTELAMREFVSKLEEDFDFLCLLQATSPLISSEDINLCIQKVELESFDSVLTTVRIKRFTWDETGESVNYDYKCRPRRQEFPGILVENGAIYIVKKQIFNQTGLRIGGNIGIVEMPEDTFVEIDDLVDWEQIIPLLKRRLKRHKNNIKRIRAMIFDVDGVMTDGNVLVSAQGELAKAFSLRDGMGLQMLREEGIIPIVMTSEESEIVRQRVKKLNIENAYYGVKDKYSRLEQTLNYLGINRSEIAYMGDDVNDHANICSAGWGIVPHDAESEIKVDADIILNANGGERAIREAINIVLNYNKRFLHNC